ncbi:hypothetical protein Ciccas_012244 [Cichlidogyrus casuarinus]|uniref:Solute carrier family 25 member 40 n=1 Tax=Cichlidogyrus casuarinus TaxID=1844966 RepID=A0ABD2PP23_9PLAT
MLSQLQERLTITPTILSSFIGGSFTALVMTPLDVVKIRMQASHQIAQPPSSCFIYCNGLMDHLCTCLSNGNGSSPKSIKPWYLRPIHALSDGNFTNSSSPTKDLPNTCVEALISIVKNEGLSSLWSGLSPTLFMALPSTIVYYSCADWIKEVTGFNEWLLSRDSTEFHPNKWEAYHLIPPISGGISRIIAVFCVSPIELVRTKMQSKPFTVFDIYRAIKTSIRTSGFRSLWMGAGPTLLRDVPYSMIFWASVEAGRYQFIRQQSEPHSIHLPFKTTFAIGLASGFFCGVLTHPFDVIKTHRQLQLGDAIVANKPYDNRTSTFHLLKVLYQHKGWSGILSGFTPRLIKTSLASAVMLSTFETMKKVFETE